MAIRPGMIWLVNHLRTLIDDQRETYLDDETLQRLLDGRRSVHNYTHLQPEPIVWPGGAVSYLGFRGGRFWEGSVGLEFYDGGYNRIHPGTAPGYGSAFVGDPFGTVGWMDLLGGSFGFAGTLAPGGTIPQGPDRPVMARGCTYDVYGAAADALEIQAAQVAQDFDFQTEGVSYSRSQKHEQLMKQAERYRSMSCTAVSFAEAIRRDAN